MGRICRAGVLTSRRSVAQGLDVDRGVRPSDVEGSDSGEDHNLSILKQIEPASPCDSCSIQNICYRTFYVSGMVLGVDELDMLCGPWWGDPRMCPEFYHLVNYGRHCKVSMLAAARRPMNVARGYTSQCLSMRLFCMTERTDLKYFEDYIGRGDSAQLPGLPKYQYLHWTGDGPAVLSCAGRALS
jgi:hypothetical protein